MNDSISTPTVPVAPRELQDFVYRITRVDGFDPAASMLLGQAAVAATAAGHDGAALLLDMIDASTICDVLLAVDAIADGEVEAHTNGSADVDFDPPVPEAMVLATLHEAAARGVTRTSSSQVDGQLTSMSLTIAEPTPTAAATAAFALAQSTYDELLRRSDSFLVSEATLDALVDDD